MCLVMFADTEQIILFHYLLVGNVMLSLRLAYIAVRPWTYSNILANGYVKKFFLLVGQHEASRCILKSVKHTVVNLCECVYFSELLAKI